MTGQDAIEQLRREGRVPVAAFLVDYATKPWPVGEQLRDGVIPTLSIAGEEPAVADCRFLTGMRVHLHCNDMTRAMAWVDRLLQDGAKHVIQLTGEEVYEWRP